MADPGEESRQGPADAVPRRQPPTIEAKAVELPLDDGDARSARGADGTKPPGEDGAEAGSAFPRAPKARWRLAASTGGAAVVVLLLGAAAWWGTDSSQRSDELRARVAQLETRPRDAGASIAANAAAARIEDLSTRLARLEAAAASSPPGAAITADTSALAGVDAALDAMAARLDELARRSRESADSARRAGERAEAVAGQLADLKKSDSAAAAAAPAASPETDERLAALASRVDAQEASLTASRAEADAAVTAAATAAATAATKPLRAGLVAAALGTAVARATPFVQELAAARALGLDPEALAALQPVASTGVPSAGEMTREFSALMPELARATAPAGHDGYLDRLQAGAERLVRIRPVNGETGDNPAAVISRIEASLAHQDLSGVMTDLDRLPASAQAIVEPWRTRMGARAAAIDAARELAAQSFARLGDAAVPASR